MREKFKINDYVVYLGDGTTLEPRRRNKDYAKIIDLKKIGNIEYVGLQLSSLNEKISCPLNQINNIETSKTHLLNLGFKEENSSDKIVCYIKNNIFISKLGLRIPVSIYNNNYFIAGFCLADFRIISNNKLEKYIIDDKIDVAKFFAEFQSLYNINVLFDVLEIKEDLIIDREKIINTIPIL